MDRWGYLIDVIFILCNRGTCAKICAAACAPRSFSLPLLALWKRVEALFSKKIEVPFSSERESGIYIFEVG